MIMFPIIVVSGIVTIQFLILEGDYENLRQLPDHFSPTSGPAGLMEYLELIFLRFQELICRISHFCILLS